MASCSRDSTVRLWSLTPLIAPLLINILTEHSWDDIIGNTGELLLLHKIIPQVTFLKPTRIFFGILDSDWSEIEQ